MNQGRLSTEFRDRTKRFAAGAPSGISCLLLRFCFLLSRFLLFRCFVSAGLLALFLSSGCSRSSHGDPQPSTLNPQPAAPWTNSLGMVFVPVPGTKVQFCIWETRVQDFTAFVDAAGYDATQGAFSPAGSGWAQDGHNWKNPGFEQGPTHPVAGVSWDDANAFCTWLTERDRKAGVIQTAQAYRLPTDAEWSTAIGLTGEGGGTPAERQDKAISTAWAHASQMGIGMRTADIYANCFYPWGPKWPPPKDFGNYPEDFGVDAYPFTAPVGSFRGNALGLFDLSGNVWEWCEDLYAENRSWRVYRGGSFHRGPQTDLVSWARGFGEPSERYLNRGFRVVIGKAESRK